LEYTTLGKTGIKISRIGLGAWQLSEAWTKPDLQMAKSVVSKAVGVGINFFDTAMVYGLGTSEYLLGRALREAGVKRDEVVVVTKIPGDFLNERDVPLAVEKSVKILGLGYIDVLLAHWPPAWHNYPVCEYARAMERMVKAGFVRFIGLSNFPPPLVDAFRSCLSTTDVEVFQIRYNLVERYAEKELIPYAEKNRITVMAWSPIAKGALTGKYTPENLPQFQDVRSGEAVFHPKNFREVYRVVEVLKSVAAKYGKTPAQVAMNWLITSSPVVVPIPGAKSAEQVEENAGSVGWRLSAEDWALLDKVSREVRILYSYRYLEREFQ